MPSSRAKSGRAAAWIALVAVGAMVAALVLLALRHLAVMLLVLGCLLVTVGAAWVALTRRGVIRTLALVVVALGLVGSGVALVADDAFMELVVLAVAGAVFVAAAHAALRRPSALQPPSARPRPRPGRAVLVMNPKSGGGKVETFDLVNEARRRRIEPVVLGPGDDLRQLAEELVRSADMIGMAGGDGSQALVAEVAMAHGVPYVCVPAGTRNHLAADLGLNREDVVGALDGFTDGVERRIDVAFVNGRVFVNNVSLGIYAKIVQSDSYRNAKVATAQEMLPELLGPRAAPFDLRFRDPDGVVQRSAQLLLVSNNPYVVDHLVGVGTRPRMDTGKLGIVSLEIGTAAQAMELVSFDAVGQLRRFKGWREWSAAEFDVASSAPVAAGIDGEAVVLDPPLHFRIAPAALRVSVPPSARSVGALSELWRIATAHLAL